MVEAMTRRLLAWALFRIGDLIWRLNRRLGWEEYRRPCDLYQWFMTTSSRVQGHGRGPWRDAN